MPWKMDGDHIVLSDGSPVWIDSQKRESAVKDVDGMLAAVQEARDELNQTKTEAKERRLKIKELEEKAKAFEGLDPEEARKALHTVSSLKDKDKQEAEKLSALEKALKEAHAKELGEYKTKLDKAGNDIRELTIKTGFASSKFLQEKTILPGDIAFAYFGHHFTVEELDGRPAAVAKLNGNTIYSKDPNRAGKPADVDEALSIIVMENYPNKEKILAGAAASGSGATGNSNKPGDAGTVKVGLSYPSMQGGK